ncbi:hypothetical protein [Streptomyces sp. NPDC001020]
MGDDPGLESCESGGSSSSTLWRNPTIPHHKEGADCLIRHIAVEPGERAPNGGWVQHRHSASQRIGREAAGAQRPPRSIRDPLACALTEDFADAPLHDNGWLWILVGRRAPPLPKDALVHARVRLRRERDPGYRPDPPDPQEVGHWADLRAKST